MEPFLTRGVVLLVNDITTLDWPSRAREAGLTTLATHIHPQEIAAFAATDAGQAWLAACADQGLQVEHELHAMSDLLPRELFGRRPGMFRMNDEGERTPDANLCVHSAAALEIACGNAAAYTRLLPATSGRYFYWIDDGRPMCRCPACRGYSDSDQALLLENRLLGAIREVDPRATLAHLCYHNTLPAPTRVRPVEGIFLEFAPIARRYDVPFAAQSEHAELLDQLDHNLALFGAEGAQVLEYWLDLSRFSGWRRENVAALPWHADVLSADLDMYAARGIRHVSSFACWLDGDYVRRFGEPPLGDYGRALGATDRPRSG